MAKKKGIFSPINKFKVELPELSLMFGALLFIDSEEV
jgi:hypothetical protein